MTIALFAAMFERLLPLGEHPICSILGAVEHSMKKEELEALLGDGENTPDLGPIEEHLHAVATEFGAARFRGRHVRGENRRIRAELARCPAAGRGWRSSVGR
jgi:hypothetical protein